MNRKMFILSGCNGAGKTTAAAILLPSLFERTEFVNADNIAREISPDNPDSAAIKAGRIMLQRINQLIEENKSFTIETTLSTLFYQNLIKKAKDREY